MQSLQHRLSRALRGGRKTLPECATAGQMITQLRSDRARDLIDRDLRYMNLPHPKTTSES